MSTPIAVIGAGKFGENHVRLLAGMEGVDLVGVFDADPARRTEVAEKHGTRAFATVDEAVAAAKGAVIVTPTAYHRALAEQCLNAGLPVFVEKPMTATLDEAERLVALSASTGVPVQVGHIERFNPVVKAARPLIGEARFFEIHRITPFPNRSLDVDVVLDLMIHDLDLLLSFVDSEVRSIQAAGMAVLSEKLDMVSARLEFANGCVANITTSRTSLKAMRVFRVFTGDRYVSLDLLHKAGTVARRERDEGAPFPHVQAEAIEVPESNQLADELTQFRDVVGGDAVPDVDAAAGRDNLVLAHKVLDAVGEHRQRCTFGEPLL